MKKWSLLLFFATYFAFLGNLVADELSVEMLDVGQADSFLLRTQGKTVLIDAGEAKEMARDQLFDRKISRLDMVVGTHPHADHIGGMEAVLESFNIGVYLDHGFPHTTVLYDRVMTLVESKVNSGQMKYRIARRGQRINFGTEAYFDVLFPGEIPLSGTRSDINANSIILKLTHGNNCFLFMGDAEAETEAAILDIVGTCQVLKASHHGSRHSSIDALLDTVKPEIALISCGLANKHGHPGAETLERYALRGIKDYRTDLSGAITIISDGKTLRVIEEHPPIEIVKININLAGIEALKQLPGVGDKTAESIISYREANGYFKDINDVLLVDPRPNNQKRLAKILPFIVTEGGSSTGLLANSGNSEANPYLVSSISSGVSLVYNPGVFQNMSQRAANDAFYEIASSYSSCGEMTDLKGVSRFSFERRSSVCGSAHGAKAYAKYQIATTALMNQNTMQNSGIININEADEISLAKMPGMSASKARALIAHREANGAFTSCERVVDVKGIGKKTYEKLAASCTTVNRSPAPVQKELAPLPANQGTSFMNNTPAGVVNINVASVEDLRNLPGMSVSKAQKLVEDRTANGFFRSCEEVTRVKGIGSKTVEKFISRCTVQ